MRILAVSDLRVQDVQLLEHIAQRVRPDLILYAGDDVARFASGRNSWSPLAQRTPLGLAGIIGNDCAPTDASALEQSGCRDLQRSPLLLDGIAFLGLQGAPSDECKPMGQNLYTRRQAKAHLERQLALAGKRHIILVSHAPPRGVLDEAIRFGFEHAGSTTVKEFTRRPRVRAVVCGHVHLQGGRVQNFGKCTVVNVASHDHQSAPLRYSVLEWDGRRLQVTLGSEKDHRCLAALPGIGAARADKLERAGFRSTTDLLDAQDDALANVCSTAEVARRLRAAARARETGKPVLVELECRFPEDAIILDVETSLKQDDPWLVGFKQIGAAKVRQLEELRPKGHEAHLHRLNQQLLRLSPRQFIQWGAFDRGALCRAHRKVGIDVPAWLEPRLWMDAAKWVQRVVALPLPDAKLKTVARYFGYKFGAGDLDGMTVGLWYSRFLRSRKAFDVRLVRSYNRDDVRSVEFIGLAVRALVESGDVAVEPLVKFAKSVRRPHRRAA